MANFVPSNEHRLIHSLKNYCGKLPNEYEFGIGDDCAVLNSNGKLLFSVDTMVENVHFSLEFMSLEEVGYKAITSSISDIYAMGGVANSVLIQVTLPKSSKSNNLEKLYKGVNSAIKEYRIAVVGGDISRGGEWNIGVTVIGQAKNRVLYRNRAKVGDSIYVSGIPGLSSLGLNLLFKYGRSSAEVIDTTAVFAHIKPRPRERLASMLGNDSSVTSMIDISDGVGKEVRTICTESSVGAKLFLPYNISDRLLNTNIKQNPVDLFLNGGEDYELLFTASNDFTISAYNNITKIGEVVEGGATITVNGKELPLNGGWDHI